ncbi:hypothetical protein PG991_000691 [Apiospora marii]|uniref:Carrier domain-containing protein n=1 Tax=Apiospora marii TaxID=335849 RepID=A0ABR1SSN2_9PEZI
MTIPEPIAIIGKGCRLPGNVNTPSELWDVLCNPRDLLSSIPEGRFSTRGFFHEDGHYHGHTNVEKSYLLSTDSSYRHFDAHFFGISPAEARVMDPQMRLLLEIVYEALEDAGQSIDGLQGSDTAVYAGLMTSDYEHIMGREEDGMGTYHVTGTSRALMSNRISYFFDWHGPSMTIDTACSSSLYAVHYAVQQLRSGASRVAVAAGSNLLLDPAGYVAESKLQMLSPSSRSRMWDANADGYARGEGVAAIILKSLSAAQLDGDHIDCIIRETGVNQDGRTQGITVPSARAQADLIRGCYSRAGLDVSKSSGRPQFFEAHGTGTPSGDPIEAEAISKVFGEGGMARNDLPELLVGSYAQIKTLMGHTEATAGLAGILKVSLALQQSIVPPNLLFSRLNPKIEPFYEGLRIPTSTVAWPAHQDTSPRRASVNSFGFGGANAHAILESYPRPARDHVDLGGPIARPFIFSAASNVSLVRYLECVCDYLKTRGASVNMRNLAYTLHSRRTRFSFVAGFSASSPAELAARVEQRIHQLKTKPGELAGTQAPIRSHDDMRPRVLAVFTGQGAQWARMGAKLLAVSASARQVIEELQARLLRLPAEDRPAWTIAEEIQKGTTYSRMGDAEISQPLCTAVEILLVDVLRQAHVDLTAVVGHSSGEIAAAYAAGVISAEDAICIAYYRGRYAHLARGRGAVPGAMMAVESSAADVDELLREPEFVGRACVAAVNSSTSVTVSGDADAIDELRIVFKDEKKFTRILKVDRAYHSHHMTHCSTSYLHSLRELNIEVRPMSRCKWFSSVYPNDFTNWADKLNGPYWDNNMLRPVLFEQAMICARVDSGPFDMIIEVGPHPALKGPCLQNMEDITGHRIPYTGLLRRGTDDMEALTNGLLYVSKHAGKGYVDFQSCDAFISGATVLEVVKALPPYSWNHKEFWHESMYSRALRGRSDAVNELLGHLSPDSTEQDMRWKHLLRPKEIPWLKCHQLQNQIVFPAAGYVATALESARFILGGTTALTIELSNIDIGQALTFDNEDSSVEIVFSVTNIIRRDNGVLTASFTYNAATGRKTNAFEVFASGSICIHDVYHSREPALPVRDIPASNLIAVDANEFYDALSELEYQYSGEFLALSDLKRKLGFATGTITNVESSRLLVPPAVIDAAFQSILLAESAPGDGRLWSMHVPRRIETVVIDFEKCTRIMPKAKRFAFDASQSKDTITITGDVDIFSDSSIHAIVQIEGLECVPLAEATERDDKTLFSTMRWGTALPSEIRVAYTPSGTSQMHDLACLLQRMSCFYLRELILSVPLHHKSRNGGPYTLFFKFASHTLTQARLRGAPFWEPGWDDDTFESVALMSAGYHGIVDVRLLQAIGQRLGDIVMNNQQAIEIGMRDNLLANYYKDTIGMAESLQFVSSFVKQLGFISPRLKCLEVGAGTGGATKAVLKEAGQTISSYTFTDVSSGFFESAQTVLSGLTSCMQFKVFDITKSPDLQGFKGHSYDLIVASMVLHATPSLKQTLAHLRSLLRPGGYLVALEICSDAPSRVGTIFGAFPGWWAGRDEGRDLTPCIDLNNWDVLLRDSGFSGCDTSMQHPDSFIYPMTVFASQAVDNRVAIVRDPLQRSTAATSSPDKIIQDLVILGGSSLQVSGLIKELQNILNECSNTITHFTTLADARIGDISSRTTVLSLVDIDWCVFQSLDVGTWESLKFILEKAGTMLWVSQGRRFANPHSNMACGLFRCVRNEISGLEIQTLDIEDEESLNAVTIGEALIRFSTLAGWKRSNHQEFDETSLLVLDQELVIEKGRRLVSSRVIPHKEMNKRYNSSRRPIFEATDLAHCLVSLIGGSSNQVVKSRSKDFLNSKFSTVVGRTSYALLAPVRVPGHGQLFLSLGSLQGSQTQFVALSTTQTSGISQDTFFALPVAVASDSEASLIYLVSLFNLAAHILDDVKEGCRIIVHEPAPELISVVESRLDARDLQVVFTTSGNYSSPMCIPIHPQSPNRLFKSLNIASTDVFYSFALTNDSLRVADRLRSHLPKHCRIEAMDANTQIGRAPSSSYADKVQTRLRDNVADACDLLSRCPEVDLQYRLVKPWDVSKAQLPIAPQPIVDWSRDDTILTKVLPIDSQPLFSSSKTYWLAGLSGSLGLSLDVAKQDDIAALYGEIRSTLPEIGGIAHGAMVLHDSAISTMGLDVFQDVTRPKVEGSMHMDNLFRNTPLDFFVFFSSLSAAIGSPGQSAYVAANAFMVSLAEQRRSRGLAASVIDIGPVVGAGYITQNQITATAAKSLGMLHMSEKDFHQLFAEAVAAGSPGSDTPIEIISGARLVRTGDKTRPIWASNPLMSHHVLNEQLTGNVSIGKSPKESLQALLYKATSHDAVHKLVKDAILGKLEALLELDSGAIDDPGLDSTRLDELGLDSLMATEIRTWLLRLHVNYPVLKILSGISVSKLVEDTVEGIPLTLIPQVQGLQDPLLAVETDPITSQPNPHVEKREVLPDTDTCHILDDTPDPSIPEHGYQVQMRSSPTLLSSMELSLAQCMFWTASQLFEDRASLNIAASCRIIGPLDPSRLQSATMVVSQRHEALRTSFKVSGGNVEQSVMAESSARLMISDIIDEKSKDIAIAQALTDVQQHHFDLESGETLRLILLRLTPTDHFLIIGTSHLVMDGLSLQIFLTALLWSYNQTEEISTTLQYREHVQAQRHNLDSGEFQMMFRFWQAQYPEFPSPLPILSVSSAKTRASLTKYNNDRVEVLISPRVKTQIQELCRRCRTTPFHFYLACYRALLTRYSVPSDVAIGVTDSNRTAAQVNSIGVYNNVLPLRFFNNVHTKFEDMLRETRSIVYAGLEHSQLPFQAILEGQGQRKRLAFGNLVVEPLAGVVSKTGYDLALDLTDDPEGDCLVALIGRTDLYQKREAEILVKSYENLVKAFAAEPSAKISVPRMYEHNASMLSLTFGQGRLRESQWPETVIHRIDTIWSSFPDILAIEESLGTTTTYGELMCLSYSIATSLVASGAVVGSKVATLQEPTARWVASLLAIMRIGAIYIPLDLSQPWARLAAIMNECEPRFLLLDQTTNLKIHKLQKPEMLLIDVSGLVILPQSPPPIAAAAGSQAMMLFTSGSSGTPKGITLRHEGLRNWIEPAEELYGIGAERVLQQSTCTFDMSLEQILFALCFGGSIFLPERSLRGDACAIAELIAQKGITFTVATPTEYGSWIKHGYTDSLAESSWRVAVSGGEHVANHLVTRFRDMGKADLRFYNTYGPTETTVIATAMEVQYEDGNSSTLGGPTAAGFPLPNYSVFVEDIFATEEARAKGWTRMHRSGDVGRWTANGALLIEGRITGDTQVKLRGIRIDLREVEGAILKEAGSSLSEAVVSVRSSTSEPSEFLVSHVVFDPAYPETRRANFLRSLLASLPLPKYMCPAAIIPISLMPINSSSKLDRKAISQLPLEEDLSKLDHWEKQQAELTEPETRLSEIWLKVVQETFPISRPIMAETDFFHVGGTSLLLLNLRTAIRKLFGVRLRVADMIEASTLGDMVRLIQNKTPAMDNVNWEEETRPTIDVQGLSGPPEEVRSLTQGRVIVLTGTTGFLGRAILHALVDDPTVARVNCIAIRHHDQGSRRAHFPVDDGKTYTYEGDLTAPRLGLGTDDARRIFSEADCIIHCGAQVSHSQSYRSLRLPNLQSTQELISMCVSFGHRTIPMHYISTAQVGVFYAAGTGRREFPEISLAVCAPAQAPGSFEGYQGTKWASERFLERLHHECAPDGWPVCIHRPTMISRADSADASQREQDILGSIRRYSALIAAVPAVPDHCQGVLDSVALGDVVAGILDAVRNPHSAEPGVRFRHYFGKESLELDDGAMRVHLLSLGDGEGQGSHIVGRHLPMAEWVKRAVKIGLHPHVAKWMESMAVPRKQVYPKVIH